MKLKQVRNEVMDSIWTSVAGRISEIVSPQIKLLVSSTTWVKLDNPLRIMSILIRQQVREEFSGYDTEDVKFKSMSKYLRNG